MEYNATPLQLSELQFKNQLSVGQVELHVQLDTNITIPNNLNEKEVAIIFDTLLHDEGKKFVLNFKAKTKISYSDNYQSIEELKSDIDNILPELRKIVFEKVTAISNVLGINPIQIEL